jgi:hypothetical protein
MNSAARSWLHSLLLLSLLGCGGGDPIGPSGNTLTVSILGLPNGASAAVSINGPNSYTQALTSSQTLTQLTPGAYTLTASSVTAGAATYSPSPANQTVSVQESAPTSTSVTYAAITGNLKVTIGGLGTSRPAVVTVTGPGGYSAPVTTTKTLTGLNPGSYTVTAQNVTASCGSTFTASPLTQSPNVSVGTTANAGVTYTPPSGGTPNLCIDGMYLTQSAQSYAGTVPLVQGRQGFLRVFAVADRANTLTPTVQVRFYQNSVLVQTVPLTQPALSGVPTAPDESQLSFSWNYSVPSSLIQVGMRVEAEVNPGGVGESTPSDNIFAPPTPTVRIVPPVNIKFVPVVQPGGLTGQIDDLNKDQFLDITRRMHPISSINATVRAPISVSAQLQATGGGWQNALLAVDAARVSDASADYYYGVARVSYNSGVAGIAFVSDPSSSPPDVARAALGWDDLPTGSVVAAHELGHNWARNHAPCGGPAGVDPAYPQLDGSTGGYGLDMFSAPSPTIEPPNSSDIMAYCPLKWISEYTYRGVLDYLSPGSPMIAASVVQPVQPCLLVWGYIRDGQPVLQPAFQINTRPTLPDRSGPYSMEARAEDGSSLFSYSFAPRKVADLPGEQENFVFAVPLSASKAERLHGLRVSGRGREAVTQVRAQGADSVQVRRAGGGRLRVRWNAAAHPMVLVRDPETGEVLSFAQGGDVEVVTSKPEIDVVLSNGVKSHAKRVRATR